MLNPELPNWKKNKIVKIQEYAKEHYERVYAYVPTGKREIVKDRASSLGMSVSQYISKLIEDDIEKERN